VALGLAASCGACNCSRSASSEQTGGPRWRRVTDPRVAGPRAGLLGVLETLDELAVLVAEENRRTERVPTVVSGCATCGSS
jgi:hypothetical protein